MTGSVVGLFSDSPIPCNICNIPILSSKVRVQENWFEIFISTKYAN